MSNPTREKIVASTASLFEKQGYAATGLNEIIKESGTPRGSLYYYFPGGKEELAVEAVTYRMKKVEDVWRNFLNEIEDPVDAIYELILVMAQIIENSGCDGGAPIATVALEASNSSERLRKACADGYQRPEDVLATKLVMGGFSTEQATSLAATINASIEGAMIISRARQDVTVLRGVAEHLKVLLETTKPK